MTDGILAQLTCLGFANLCDDFPGDLHMNPHTVLDVNSEKVMPRAGFRGTSM